MVAAWAADPHLRPVHPFVVPEYDAEMLVAERSSLDYRFLANLADPKFVGGMAVGPV